MAYPKSFHPNTQVGRAIKVYLGLRRALGYGLWTSEAELWSLARSLQRQHLRNPEHDAVMVWAGQHRGSRAYSAHRLESVRPFLRYYSSRYHAIDVPAAEFGGGFRRRLPHIYSPHEVRDLLDSSLSLPPVHRLRPHTLQTLLALLLSTGLRVGEALRLRRSDFDPKAGLLTVLAGKGLASRVLPIHASVVNALERYSERRDRFHPLPRSDALFLTDARGTGLQYQDTIKSFALLKRWLGWKGRCAYRIHDLRHTFAVNVLLRWQREGRDVRRLLPVLGAYLGHRHPDSTYYYLSAVSAVMQQVAGSQDPFRIQGRIVHADDSDRLLH